MKSFSATLWWSRWEVIEQLLVQFGDVEPFLQHEQIGSPATVSKLKGIFSDSSKKVYQGRACICSGLRETFRHCNLHS